MEERLGTALLRAGRIDQAALDEALEVQITTGGRLGSVLIALGHLEEEDLTRLLGDHYGLPVVDREHLDQTDPLLFGDFSRDFAAYHQVICLAVKGRIVELAMVDPGDVTAREVVEQRTRRRLELKVIPEALFWEFASRHYDLSKPERPAWKPMEPPPKKKPRREEPPEEPVEGVRKESPDLPEPTRAAVTDAPPAASTPAAPPTPQPWNDVSLGDRTDDELLATLVSATERSELGHALEIWGRRHGASFAALVLRRDEAQGWVALVDGEHATEVEAHSFALHRPSVFREVVQMRAGYQGVPPRGEIEGAFFAAMGEEPPREILILPVMVQGRVVNLLYLDGGEDGPLPPDALGALEQVADALAATYLRLILTRRARSQRDRMSEAPGGTAGG